ncbi:MAG TPA: hypothetical protein VH281_05015 [Gaiellaceae bacterium]
MPSVSGLNRNQRGRARDRVVQAALLAVDHASGIAYTQDLVDRWDGIRNHRSSFRGEFPTGADCSSFATWCLWNALHAHFHLEDIVNGEDWDRGFTGSMRLHGRLVAQTQNVCRGDCVHYDPAPPDFEFEHVTIVVGRNDQGELLVASHGGDSGPLVTEHDYRPVREIRRYI